MEGRSCRCCASCLFRYSKITTCHRKQRTHCHGQRLSTSPALNLADVTRSGVTICRASGHEPNFRGPHCACPSNQKEEKKEGRESQRLRGKETFFLSRLKQRSGVNVRQRGERKRAEGGREIRTRSTSAMMFLRRNRPGVFYIKLWTDSGRPIAKRTLWYFRCIARVTASGRMFSAEMLVSLSIFQALFLCHSSYHLVVIPSLSSLLYLLSLSPIRPSFSGLTGADGFFSRPETPTHSCW